MTVEMGQPVEPRTTSFKPNRILLLRSALLLVVAVSCARTFHLFFQLQDIDNNHIAEDFVRNSPAVPRHSNDDLKTVRHTDTLISTNIAESSRVLVLDTSIEKEDDSDKKAEALNTKATTSSHQAQPSKQEATQMLGTDSSTKTKSGIRRWCPDIAIGSDANVTKMETTSVNNDAHIPFWTVELLDDSSASALEMNNDTNITDINNTKAWHWHYHPSTMDGLHSRDNTNHSNYHTISVPAVAPFPQRGVDEILINATSYIENKKMSIVFYGSSHLRELHLSVLRLKRGQRYDHEIEYEARYIPSGAKPPIRTLACDPRNRGWVGGEYGVDLENCGVPGKRMVTELMDANQTIRVGFAFKTFLHTPDAEDVFIEWLTQQGMRHPTVLVVDVGVWGVRGRKGMPKNRTQAPRRNRPPRPPKSLNFPRTQMWLDKQVEVDYYINWILQTFANTKIVWIYEDAWSPMSPFAKVDSLIFARIWNMTQERQLTMDQNKNKHLGTESGGGQDSVVLRKDMIRRNMPIGMPCEHGCSGPVTMVVATLLLNWLAKATKGPERCI